MIRRIKAKLKALFNSRASRVARSHAYWIYIPAAAIFVYIGQPVLAIFAMINFTFFAMQSSAGLVLA